MSGQPQNWSDTTPLDPGQSQHLEISVSPRYLESHQEAFSHIQNTESSSRDFPESTPVQPSHSLSSRTFTSSSRSSFFQGPSSAHVSGGEFNSSGGDHNRITLNLNIHQASFNPLRSLSSTSLQNNAQYDTPRILPSNPLRPSLSRLRSNSLSDGVQSRMASTSSMEKDKSTSTSSNAVYERHLLQKKHGYPLWIPQPNTRLPPSYVEKGVSVGDVGIITAFGAFDYLFNICLPTQHPSNAGHVPEGFNPLIVHPRDICEFAEHTPGSYLSSASVRKLSGLSFHGTDPEGAILTMPEGGYHQDLRNITKFREYAASNAATWYRYANGPCGREIENGELHLVTGCDKTTSWGMAVFSILPNHSDDGVSLRFIRDNVADGAGFSWEHSGNVETKISPPSSESSGSGFRNQCTFIRSYTFTLSDEEWATVQASTEVAIPQSTDIGIDTYANTSNNSKNTIKRFFSSFGQRIQPSAQRNPIAPTTKNFPDPPQRTVHPSSLINRLLLQKHTNARVAVTHDDDWTILAQDNSLFSSETDLWQKMNNNFDIVLDSGTIYLSLKDGFATNRVRESSGSTGFENVNSDLRRAASPKSFMSSHNRSRLGDLNDDQELPLEFLIESLLTSPTLTQARLLIYVVSIQKPPFPSLQPVLTALCQPSSAPQLQVIGYEILAAYWEHPDMSSDNPATSDTLSCLSFLLDSQATWEAELWKPRLKTLKALTSHGNDIAGVEVVVLNILKSWLQSAFDKFLEHSTTPDLEVEVECETCISAVGKFLSEILEKRNNVSRIRDEVLTDVFKFYGTLVDRLLLLPTATTSGPPTSPLDTPTNTHPTDRAAHVGHRKRPSSLSSIMFLPPSVNTAKPPLVPVTTSKHPAEIAIALYLGHISAQMLNLSPEQLDVVLPLLFRALSFCASPLPRLALSPQTSKPASLEEQIVEALNTLIPSPSSTICMRILNYHLSPHHSTDDIQKSSPAEQDEDLSYTQALNYIRRTTMTSLGAHRTLRNYVRRALSARLASAYRPQETASARTGLSGRITMDQELTDIAWLKHDYSSGIPSASMPSTKGDKTLAASIKAWIAWNPESDFFEPQSNDPSTSLREKVKHGKESILEESAGTLKDIFSEFDSREGGIIDLDEDEIDAVSDGLRSLATYILLLKTPDDKPLIVQIFQPGDAPTPLLRSITSLLSRDLAGFHKPFLADILISICDHLTDENTARIPHLMMEHHDLVPTSLEWLNNWERLLENLTINSLDRPITRRTLMQSLHDVYNDIKEMRTHRTALTNLVMRCCSQLVHDYKFNVFWTILEEEAVSRTVEVSDVDASGEETPAPIKLLTELVFGASEDGIASASVCALIGVFCQISFSSFSLEQKNQRVAVFIFTKLLEVLTSITTIQPRLIVLQFLMRLRADRDHRVYVTSMGYDTNGLVSYMASLINRVTEPLNSYKDEVLEEVFVRHRQARPRVPQTKAGSHPPLQHQFSESYPFTSRSRSRTILPDVVKQRTHASLWKIPETLPFRTVEPDSVKNGLISYDPEGPDRVLVLPVSKYLHSLAVLVENDISWELVSYVLCHLPVQLANKHLFCGPNTRASISKLLYVLSTGVISGKLASQTGDDCPDDLRLRDLQGLAHQTLSTMISYRPYFDLQQRHLLVDAFQSGLDGPFSTIKCCLHALSLSAYELTTSLVKSLPRILEKLAQIMSNPNMAVHILVFLTIVGSIPSLYASFTEDDFKMVFGVALQYLQHYNQLRESPTRSWALLQHVRQQSYCTVYSWFSALKPADRDIHIPYITRQLLLANEGKEEVDGLTEVCLDWLSRNSSEVANPKCSGDDIILQPNIAKPKTFPPAKAWILGNSVLTSRSLDRPGWIEIVSRRPSGSATLSCREKDIDLAIPDRGPTGHFSSFSLAIHEQEKSLSTPEQLSEGQTVNVANSRSNLALSESKSDQKPLVSHLLFHISPIPEKNINPYFKDVSQAPTLPKFLALLDRVPVIDTHQVGIMYVSPGQTNESDILRNSHGSQAYTRFLDGIGKLIHIRKQKDVYTGGLDPDEDGEYIYAWWDDIRQILYHTSTMMPTNKTDPHQNNKKRHIGNDYVRIVWNDSGLHYQFETLTTAFQFVNIVVEPHSVGTISAFSNDPHENEYFRVTVQTAPGMPEFTPIGQFKIVSAVNLPHLVRQLSVFSHCFASIFASTQHDTNRVEIKTNWNARLDAIQRFKKQTSISETVQPHLPTSDPPVPS